MEIHVLTLFPGYFTGPLETGLLGKSVGGGRVPVRVHDLRAWTHDRHRTADDYPFGGGPGMVLKPEPFFEALASLREAGVSEQAPVVLTSPQGRLFDRAAARGLNRAGTFVILCGRYRGVDERIRLGLVTDEFSIGDYVLSGGEIPALVVLDAVARLVPGVIGNESSLKTDSFYRGLLGIPQYTRPRSFRGMTVPDVLLSGNHRMIERWRLKESLKRTLQRRPGLIERAHLKKHEIPLLEEAQTELSRKTSTG